MSECKHCFDLEEGKFCKRCGANFDELANDLKLTVQVAVLRKGMEFIADTTSHKRAVQLAIRFVATTPAEAAERISGLVEALEFYEKFEIDIMSDEGEKARKALAAWRGQEN